jgi:2-polyprenyl-6-methoxyphenol hydroxylase-like FAD-dependent oxidoreductase
MCTSVAPDPRRTNVYAGRSINLVVSHRGWTALRAAGVHEAVKRIVVPVYARMVHDRDGNTHPLALQHRQRRSTAFHAAS